MNLVMKFFSGNPTVVAVNVLLIVYVALLAPYLSGVVFPIASNPIGKLVLGVLVGSVAIYNPCMGVLAGVAFVVAMMTSSSYSGFMDMAEDKKAKKTVEDEDINGKPTM